ncbi:MAG: putative hydro-lyase [Porticoccaceae bacterium]|jgi:uncharacterized protein YcsI (UPF0317 family)|nr:putative hydro-lyase [Porticoccaceae bacterium]MBT7563801.1 putative hydro-lyase [Porticoccaceae bacterium]MBT7947837.1 putative hydro-lyase [Porticoccaceae bacterium]
MTSQLNPHALRLKIRSNQFKGMTSGYCQGYVQCNLVILPQTWAEDFANFCHANPKPCPLIAISKIGNPLLPELGQDVDIRQDISSYRIFEDGSLTSEVNNISSLWQDDFVAFLLGCSFSFEEALIAESLEVRNISEGVNVPMYRTNIDCTPAGPFSGKMVVSMRPFNKDNAAAASKISGRFPDVHGAPIHYGDASAIGISDINQPDYGDPVTINDGEAPLFWACGVTPQVALEQAKPPVCITHSPGCMLVTDLLNSSLEKA